MQAPAALDTLHPFPCTAFRTAADKDMSTKTFLASRTSKSTQESAQPCVRMSWQLGLLPYHAALSPVLPAATVRFLRDMALSRCGFWCLIGSLVYSRFARGVWTLPLGNASIKIILLAFMLDFAY